MTQAAPAHGAKAETGLDQPGLAAAHEVLHEVFGYAEFHPTQKQAIKSLVGGDDCLVLMPTGGGKSLCYQIPAMVRPGAGIVVSPLIALMEDQVSSLKELGISAAFLNSTLEYEEVRGIEAQLLGGQLDLLYIAPERLLGERTLALLERCELSLFAIDEAHCVSQWGHDFRREYQQLKVLHQRFPMVPRIALTATADLRTRREIASQLRLEDAALFVDSFDRPNIQYHIQDGSNARERMWRFIEQNHAGDAGIVYCLSRKRVEQVAEWLNQKGRRALPYHAGMSDADRRRNQARFLFEDGLIMVATIAFGMGIDKPDVRFVAHLNLPKSIEAYYQETGRAGRDGEAASAWMSYGLQDVILLRQMVESSDAEPQIINVMRNKLEMMLALTEMTGCRRQALLDYFGEKMPEPCGNCDNCLHPPESWDATEDARKALSCIYRTGQRFGVGYVVDVLTGRDDERIRRNGHDRISTFGIGRHQSMNAWRVIVRQLLARGLIDVDVEGMGVLRLNESCRAVLRGEQTLMLRRESKPEKSAKAKSAVVLDVEAKDQPLFEALRVLRLEIARGKGVPPFTIFHDKTLKTMAHLRPTEEAELATISGVGAYKLETYGSQFLQLITEFAVAD